MADGAKIIEVAALAARIKEMIKNAYKNPSSLKLFRSALKESTPLVEEIKNLNNHLHPPREEIEELVKEKEAAGDEIVDESLRKRIFKKVKSLSFKSRRENNMMVRDVKETLEEVKKVLESMSKENYEHGITCLPCWHGGALVEGEDGASQGWSIHS